MTILSSRSFIFLMPKASARPVFDERRNGNASEPGESGFTHGDLLKNSNRMSEELSTRRVQFAGILTRMFPLPAAFSSLHYGQQMATKYGLYDGMEVTDEVFESPASIVFAQVKTDAYHQGGDGRDAFQLKLKTESVALGDDILLSIMNRLMLAIQNQCFHQE